MRIDGKAQGNYCILKVQPEWSTQQMDWLGILQLMAVISLDL